MGTRERRQRDFEWREHQLLDLATDLLVEQGSEALTMERLAERAEYAKGTLYKHFSCREDMLCALTTRRMGRISEILRQAQRYPGNTRARLLASLIAYELYANARPDEFRLLIALVSDPFTKRASAPRWEKLESAREGLFQVLRSLFQEARDKGELPPLPMDQDPFSFGLWSLVFGTYVLNNADPDLCTRLGVDTLQTQLHNMTQLILDGAGWRPLSTTFDYVREAERIRAFLLEACPEVVPGGGQGEAFGQGEAP